MILRKPYAFLIKNFKIIHAVITLLMGYVFIKTLNVLSIFNEYFVSDVPLMGQDTSSITYPNILFVASGAIIVLSVILLWVMIIKKKPKFVYIVNIVIYIAVIVMFALGKSTMLDMEINIVDVRASKAIRDLTTFVFLAQIFPLAKNFVRAVGFDIKQFDFGKDLAELEIEEKDNEEFEVNVSVDTNKMKRGFNYTKRNLRYAIKENKVLVIIASGIFLLIVAAITLIAIFSRNSYKKMNTSFTVSNFNFKITNAYITRKSYSGNELTGLNEKMSLLVIPFEVKNNSSLDKNFLTANIMLDIGNHRFRNSTTYRDGVYDLGTVYNGEEIPGKTTESKAFIFEIPTSYVGRSMKLHFITAISIKGKDLIPTYVTVPIKTVDLDKENEVINIPTNEEVDLSKTILKNTKFTIKNAELAKRFKIDYVYPLGKENIDSYEYIYAPLDTNIDRSLLKLSYNATIDEKINLKNMYELITDYGTLKYTKDGKVKYVTSLPKVDPSKLKSNDILYIAVPSEALEAESVSLLFEIRNNNYEYVIK